MDDWTDLLDDRRTVQAIFGDRAPSLRGIELHEIVVSRDGPSVMLRFDLSEFPADPPRKWTEAGFNRVQMRLRAFAVRQLDMRGASTNPTIDLTITREGNLVRLRGSGSGVTIDMVAESALVSSDGITAYLEGEF